jgi:hypothetical protein
LWVDGKPFDLPSDARFSQAEEVFVENTDVYVAGSDYDNGTSKAVLWKNMRPIYLSKEGENGQAHSVFVSNKDVYVSGSIYRNGELKVVVWKNGVEILAKYPTNYHWGLFVSNNDLYASGSHLVNGVDYPAILKNNEPQVLDVPDTYQSGEVLSVYVSKGKVYAAGYIVHRFGGSTAALWVDGKYTKLETGTLNVWALNLAVSASNDVYVTGSANSNFVTWKNGTLLYAGADLYAGGSAIAVSGKDVYVIRGSTLWKNNIPQLLPSNAEVTYTHSVFVR